MPLKVESQYYGSRNWEILRDIKPGEQGFITNRKEGITWYYVFGCDKNGESSKIYLTQKAIQEKDITRLNYDENNLVKKLEIGDALTIQVRTIEDDQKRNVRFTHI